MQGAAALTFYGAAGTVTGSKHMLDDGLSAHGDQSEILRWLGGFRKPPAQTYLVHGEPEPARVLAQVIRERLGWTVEVARDGVPVPSFA